MKTDKVLSFSINRDVLVEREAALRNGGFEVTSVASESQARFEIEMGNCGILLLCFRASENTTQYLTDLFRDNCANGIIIFVMNRTRGVVPCPVDRIVFESDGPQAIVDALRNFPAFKAS